MQTQRTNLLKLKNAFVANLTGKSGQKKACLVIPIEDAYLYAGDKGVYLDTLVYENKDNSYGDTHLVKQSIPKKIFEAMSEEERRQIPILDNIRPMASKTITAAPTIEPDQISDDLPF